MTMQMNEATMRTTGLASATIIVVLRSHSVGYRIAGGKLQAEGIYSIKRNGRTVSGREWVTVDGWTRSQLFAWLGY
jgi:SLT domain-containing protein